ncbi:protein FAM110C [Alosa pseudoharengus]|uniref:protein FAM110C n=1 Tax=Alosa pseudoharengus TaxID=34774 RepID=UPI003F8940BA
MQGSSGVGTSRILGKGPEFLRKQLELESEGKAGMTAAERLAASKPRYVKSQQVVNSTQETVICLNTNSVSSNDSSKRSSSKSGNEKATTEKPVSGEPSPPEDTVAVRRSSSKKRPDSLMLYRQKCELIRGSPGVRHERIQARRMLLNTIKDKTETVTEIRGKDGQKEEKATEADARKGGSKDSTPAPAVAQSENRPKVDICAQQENTVTGDGQERPRHKRVTEVERWARRGKGLERSHSDISSRYSKNFADFDAFFTYCGLEGDVVTSLGKENFSARSDELASKIRSVSVSTSEDRFSRSSGCSAGLQEEELLENARQATSVIERNARIIKWLYSCRNATESGKTLRELA